MDDLFCVANNANQNQETTGDHSYPITGSQQTPRNKGKISNVELKY